MRNGWLATGNSVSTPAGVIRPTLFTRVSVNQMLPSLPSVKAPGPRFGGVGNVNFSMKAALLTLSGLTSPEPNGWRIDDWPASPPDTGTASCAAPQLATSSDASTRRARFFIEPVNAAVCMVDT